MDSLALVHDIDVEGRLLEEFPGFGLRRARGGGDLALGLGINSLDLTEFFFG